MKFNDIDLPNRLTEEDLNNYFLIYKNTGNKDIRKKIIETSIIIVIDILLKNYKDTDYDLSELESIGFETLIYAVENFALDKSTKFESYLSKCVNNNIKRYLHRCYKNNNASIEELDNILIDFNQNIIDDYEEKEIKVILREFLMSLSQEEFKLIDLYFGFTGKCHTYKEIAEIYGISLSVVGKKIRNIVNRTRTEFIQLGIIDEKYDECNRIVIGKKNTLYEYFENYNEEDVIECTKLLPKESYDNLVLRFGFDLKTSCSTLDWSFKNQQLFVKTIFRIRKMLEKKQIVAEEMKDIEKVLGFKI